MDFTFFQVIYSFLDRVNPVPPTVRAPKWQLNMFWAINGRGKRSV
jgi:hypothetical protein